MCLVNLLLIIFISIYSLLFTLTLLLKIVNFTPKYIFEIKLFIKSFYDNFDPDIITPDQIKFKIVNVSLNYKIYSIIFCGIIFALAIFNKVALAPINYLQLFWLIILLSLYLAISWFDFYYQIIHNQNLLLLLFIIVVGYRFNLINPLSLENQQNISLDLVFDNFILALLLFYAISWLAKLYYKKNAFALGDVYLGAILTAFHGLENLPLLLLLSSGSGILLGIYHKLSAKKSLDQNKIPFAPCLCLASYLIFLYN